MFAYKIFVIDIVITGGIYVITGEEILLDRSVVVSVDIAITLMCSCCFGACAWCVLVIGARR